MILKDKNTAIVTAAFRGYLAAIKSLIEFYDKAGVLRTDNGAEFVTDHYSATLVEHGIGHELMAADTPKFNGRWSVTWL